MGLRYCTPEFSGIPGFNDAGNLDFPDFAIDLGIFKILVIV